MASLNFSFAETCFPSLEAQQKQLLTDHIYKHPLSYGKHVEVIKIDAQECLNSKTTHYFVQYNDLICNDVNHPQKTLVKCQTVRCKSIGTVTASGKVTFETAPTQSCYKLK